MAARKHKGRIAAAHLTFFRLSRSPRARARHGRRYPLRVHSRAARKRDRAAALCDDVFLLDGAFAGAFGIGGSRIFRLECFVRIFTVMHWPCSTTLLTVKKESGSRMMMLLAFAIPTVCGVICCLSVNFLPKLFFAVLGFIRSLSL